MIKNTSKNNTTIVIKFNEEGSAPYFLAPGQILPESWENGYTIKSITELPSHTTTTTTITAKRNKKREEGNKKREGGAIKRAITTTLKFLGWRK